ncbi:outer membrane protein OmpA-like peptidoglycan-associated protein [Spirosoma oryzae]|uniref:Outer membrane protein OmpA-like peptidoglycan-associated protein n=1 Tax=Spirosoma oryzae TaxID=1469603 RepID=A0A2T0S1Q7_9BACT|nr:OmpA family protein [Spirosoma oryzae]PRY27342.1 outer membrane protein OmpA-like peptidoglycan-associated protein [Spirosoma oryzae]
MTLFATFNDILNSDVLSRIANYVDEPAEKTRKAVDGLVYTIVGGLMKRTTTEIGVNQLFNHIKRGRYEGQLLDSLNTVLRDPNQTNTLITQGNDVISHLLPAMKSSIGSMISGYAGIRNSSSISLLGLISTITLHVLGRMVKDRKLDADGLASALFAEREAFVNAVPEDFMPRLVEKLGLQQIVSGIAAPARRQQPEVGGQAVVNRPPISYEPSGDTDTSSLGRWGVGALVLIALLGLGYYVYQNTQNHAASGDSAGLAADSTQTSDTVARSLDVPIDSANRRPATVAIPGAPTATTVAATGALSQEMTPYLGNAALPKGRVFPMPGLTFEPGSLSLTASAQATVNELATLLKTYPRMQIQLIGFANDAAGGFTNRALSFKRVNLIKQQLVTSGINYLRVDAIGRGSGVPRRSTDSTARPRPALRKIDVKVVAK